jgi:hypothetical protein
MYSSTIKAILLFLALTLPCSGQDMPLTWWSFDEKVGKRVKVKTLDSEDEIKGNYWYSEGVSGNCLKLDGYTTHVVRAAETGPSLGSAFTIEAWVAPQAYPWNWTGIVDQEKDHKEGFFFGVSADGNVGLGLAGGDDGQWLMCVSREKIELLNWSHIAATFDQSGEIAVYINGKKSGGISAGEYGGNLPDWVRPAKDVDLWIGRSHTKMYPKGTEREPSRQLLSNMVFEGLIDEVKIYNNAMNQEEIKRTYEQIQPKVAKPLSFQRFPREGAERRKFGAAYTTLKYDKTWDKLWRIGEVSDIVVTFDDPVRIVFWHGMNYAASYVTENERWMGDQSLESNEWMDDYKFDENNPNPDKWGCAEHMSDKRCLYSHVRLIENNPARVIVHWRYNPCYITYGQAHVDDFTGWGDWADEYFVIYPDVTTVRHQVLWTSRWGVVANTANWPAPGVPWHQFQETIMFNQPGTRPEDNVEDGALSIANMEGNSYKYKWKNSVSDADIKSEGIAKVPGANIQMTNLKSEYRPFIIFEPGSIIDPWIGESFTFWNHWPVAQIPSDGRSVWLPDRPSHTSFSCGAPVVHDGIGGSHEAVMLYGLRNKPIEDLVPLAKSWNNPPALKVLNGKAKSNGYDKFQRAYLLACENGASNLDLQLAGSKESPIVNPAIVFKGWGEKKISLKVGDKKSKEGVDYRVGYENHMEGTDLVLWLDLESEKSETISIIPVDK